MKRKFSLLVPVLGALLLVPAVTSQAKQPAKKAKSAAKPKVITTKSGLKYQDLKVGTGAVAKAGQQVTVHYIGTLTNGTKFDSSYDHGQPFSFPLGGHQVIAGWDEGVAGMRVGGKRKLIIPPSLGYGAQAMGDKIPANSTLIFQVELLKVG